MKSTNTFVVVYYRKIGLAIFKNLVHKYTKEIVGCFNTLGKANKYIDNLCKKTSLQIQNFSILQFVTDDPTISLNGASDFDLDEWKISPLKKKPKRSFEKFYGRGRN